MAQRFGPCMVCGRWQCRDCGGKRHGANPLTAEKQSCPTCGGKNFDWLPIHHNAKWDHYEPGFWPQWNEAVAASKRLLRLE